MRLNLARQYSHQDPVTMNDAPLRVQPLLQILDQHIPAVFADVDADAGADTDAETVGAAVDSTITKELN